MEGVSGVGLSHGRPLVEESHVSNREQGRDGGRGVSGYLEEVVEVFEDPDADLVQVLEEAVEDGHQVCSRELVSQDHRQLMDGEGQGPSHLPLGRQRDGEREKIFIRFQFYTVAVS